MSRFFNEDIVALKSDAGIVGTVAITWSYIEDPPQDGFDNCYIHKDLPRKVKKAWFLEERLLPGYVSVELMQPHDGFLLIAESSLELVDRSLAVGDVVKRNFVDSRSGTVVSTSLMCALEPLCSPERFSLKSKVRSVGFVPSVGPHAKVSARSDTLTEGSFSNLDTDTREVLPLGLEVPASELVHWNDYREEDFIIYNDWIGQVLSILDEVTVRLSNGSVVTVENAEELEEPYFLPDSESYQLARRLDRAGYYQHCTRRQALIKSKPQAYGADCYPGQIVQTKKGNLRRGRWKFGAYDPNIEPVGIVVDVRCVSLEVEWLFPNIFNPNRSQVSAPLSHLDTDILDHKDIIKYDRSRIPNNVDGSTLPDSSHSPDTGFGHRVRFRDSSGAAAKYNSVVNGSDGAQLKANFDRIPRSATQGFDMNVFQVIRTKTKALVRWQDNTLTEEYATALTPYLNPDDHEIWPGDRVSFQPDEESLVQDGLPILRCRTIGVVQSVNSWNRIACVRWFEDSSCDLEAEEKIWQLSTSTSGQISDRQSDVSLYEIAAHPALAINRGELAVIFPDPIPPLSDIDIQNYMMMANGSRLDPNALVALSNSEDNGSNLAPTFYGLNSARMAPLAAAFDRANQMFRQLFPPGSDIPMSNISREIDWFGEVVDVCFDGTVVVRLGASENARYVELPSERVMVIASGDAGESDLSSQYSETDEESDLSGSVTLSEDGESMSEDEESTSTDASVEPIDITIDYEGGRNLGSSGDEDEEMWLTDGEDEPAPAVPKADTEQNGVAKSSSALTPDSAPEETTWSGKERSKERTISYASYTSMPSQFAILEEPAPLDHHYHGTNRPITADLMRRVTKEHSILQSSLPDGVFIRTWESRLDLLRILIVGPADTPYEFAPFVFDLHFGSSFPSKPPDAHFHSWTNGHGRVNPNLYEDGKICLSLLGTWHTDGQNEGWSPKKSTVLQIVVSVMGLVLVKEPYYNEAGFDILINTPESLVPSALYSEKAYILSRDFINTALTSPPPGLEDVIQCLYRDSRGSCLLRRILADCKEACSMERKQSKEEDLGGNGEGEGKGRGKERVWMNFSQGGLVLLEKSLVGLRGFVEAEGEAEGEMDVD